MTLWHRCRADKGSELSAPQPSFSAKGSSPDSVVEVPRLSCYTKPIPTALSSLLFPYSLPTISAGRVRASRAFTSTPATLLLFHALARHLALLSQHH